MHLPGMQATQINDYLQALGKNRASPEVTEWILQVQIPAIYLACLPPEQSQDTSSRLNIVNHTSTLRLLNKQKNPYCLICVAFTHNDVGMRQVLEQLHFFFELSNMCLTTKCTSYETKASKL